MLFVWMGLCIIAALVLYSVGAANQRQRSKVRRYCFIAAAACFVLAVAFLVAYAYNAFVR